MFWSRYEKIYEVLRGIYCVLSLGFDSNIYIIKGDDELLVVDTGLGFSTALVFKMMIESGLDPKNVKYIVNTHCHIDHIGGNPDFINVAEDVKVLVHETDGKYMVNGDINAIEPLSILKHDIKPFKVDIMLKDGDKVRIGDYELKVIHTPGHSPGCICLYDDEYKVLISGDTVFLEGFGRYDLPYSNYRDLVNSIEKLSKLEVKALLPGHGLFTTKNGSKYIKMDLEWIKEFNFY